MSTSQPPIAIDTTPAHARGWTPALKARFLDRLAAHGNARAACRAVNLSPEAAYRLRRRDDDFARGWAAALALARENGIQVLGERAIEGIEEQVWHRGKLVGTRRRFDTRLLLAHLARLDRLVDEQAGEDAARFDELVARIAGTEAPGMDDRTDRLVPPWREELCDNAAEAAEEEVERAWTAAARGRKTRRSAADDEAYAAECAAAAERARAEAGADWDAWFARACGVVDALTGWTGVRPLPGLPGNPLPPDHPVARAARAAGAGEGALSFARTLSDASTSALARALAGPVRAWPGIDVTPRGRKALRRSAIDLVGAAA